MTGLVKNNRAALAAAALAGSLLGQAPRPAAADLAWANVACEAAPKVGMAIKLPGTHAIDLRDPAGQNHEREPVYMLQFKVIRVERGREIMFLEGVKYVPLPGEAIFENVRAEDIRTAKVKGTGAIPCNPAVLVEDQKLTLEEYAKRSQEKRNRERFAEDPPNLAPPGTVLGVEWIDPRTNQVHFFVVEVGEISDGVGSDGNLIPDYTLHLRIADVSEHVV